MAEEFLMIVKFTLGLHRVHISCKLHLENPEALFAPCDFDPISITIKFFFVFVRLKNKSKTNFVIDNICIKCYKINTTIISLNGTHNRMKIVASQLSQLNLVSKKQIS